MVDAKRVWRGGLIMPLDPRLAMMFRPTTELQDPQDGMLRALRARGMMQGNRLADMQMQAYQTAQQRDAQEQARAQQERQRLDAWLQSLPSAQDAAPGVALGGDRRPTPENATRIIDAQRRLDFLRGGVQAGAFKPQDYAEALFPKPQQMMNVAPGGSVFDPTTKLTVYSAPFKPESETAPPLVRLQAARDALPTGDPRRRELQALIDNQTRPPSAPSQPMQSVAYVDPATNQVVWGTINEARGKRAANFSPDVRGGVAAAVGAGTEGGKTGVEVNAKLYAAATNAAQAIPRVDELIRLLESGNVNAGLAGEIKQGLDRAQSLLGGKDSARRASDTQIADVLMGSEVFPLIQSLGIGARGMDTPAERQFMRQVLTGDLALEKDTLLRMARMRRDTFQRSIDNFNGKVDQGELDAFFSSTGFRKGKINVTGNGATPAAPKPGAVLRFDAQGNPLGN